MAGGSPADQQVKAQAQMSRAQERVSACMRKQGFEYVPFTGNVVGPSFDRPKDGEEVAWKRKHGYGFAEGMSTMSSRQSDQPKDPNDAIRNKLSKWLSAL